MTDRPEHVEEQAPTYEVTRELPAPAEVNELIAVLRESAERLGAAEARLAALNDEAVQAGHRVEEAERAIEAKLGSLEEELRRRLDEVDRQLQERLAGLEAQAEEHRRLLDAIQAERRAWKDLVDTAVSQAEAVARRAEAVAAAAEARAGRLAEEVKRHAQRLAILEAASNELSERTDKIERRKIMGLFRVGGD